MSLFKRKEPANHDWHLIDMASGQWSGDERL